MANESPIEVGSVNEAVEVLGNHARSLDLLALRAARDQDGERCTEYMHKRDVCIRQLAVTIDLPPTQVSRALHNTH